MSTFVNSVQSSLTQPEFGFAVYHHHVVPSFFGVAINTTVVGTYPSLTGAQTAALNALHIALAAYEQAGVRGNVSDIIDLQLRGLITGVSGNGVEQPLSEFEIRLVRVWSDTWSPEMGEDIHSLMQDVDEHGNVQIKVKLPWAKPIPMPKDDEQLGLPGPLPEEKDPHWAQTRIPYFRRRDDTPFRRADDPPYSADMKLVSGSSRSRARPIIQIVTPQPDELAGLSTEEQQSTVESQEAQSGTVDVTHERRSGAVAALPADNASTTQQPAAITKPKQMNTGKKRSRGRKKKGPVVGVKEIQPDEDGSSRESSTPAPPRLRDSSTNSD